jgi:hypothetical protein
MPGGLAEGVWTMQGGHTKHRRPSGAGVPVCEGQNSCMFEGKKAIGKQNSNSAYYITPYYITIKTTYFTYVTSLASLCNAGDIF